ncbi:MAG: hypothetical protein U0744_15990 [Gemmataceae bacterium]
MAQRRVSSCPDFSLPLTSSSPSSPKATKGEGTFAPMTRAEMQARGWGSAQDVVFVTITGDAYIDHPSFAMAILHRVLEQAGPASPS